ncbi:MAG TPA: hypothetical protein VKB46_16270 [Pyrinomonadaceae bacterium]|nr:hypothetical protein [Pyrinomonadaceae bacterium]
MKHSILRWTNVLFLTTLLSISVALGNSSFSGVQGQGNGAATAKDTLSGKYEGTATRANGQSLPVVMELKNDAGKVSGRATSGQNVAEISEGTLADGKLSLKFQGQNGVLTAKVEGDKITGEWGAGPQKQTVDLKKVAVAAAAADPAAAPVELAGEWDAVADAQGQPFPFTLVLKIEGEKVTGSSTSQLGESTISNGTWKDGQLNFQLDSQNGTVVMSATVVEGKLSGAFDFAGQMQGKWVAVKKK